MTKIIAKLYKLSYPQPIDKAFMRMLIVETYGQDVDIEVVEMTEEEKLQVTKPAGNIGGKPLRVINNHLMLFEALSDGEFRRLSSLERRIEMERIN